MKSYAVYDRIEKSSTRLGSLSKRVPKISVKRRVDFPIRPTAPQKLITIQDNTGTLSVLQSGVIETWPLTGYADILRSFEAEESGLKKRN